VVLHNVKAKPSRDIPILADGIHQQVNIQSNEVDAGIYLALCAGGCVLFVSGGGRSANIKTPCHFWQGAFILLGLIARVLLCEAIAAIDRPVATGLERHLGGGAATVADYFIHLAIATAGTAALGTALVGPAGRAATWFVCEAFLSEESLFGTRKYEFGAAVTAGKGFVIVHG
jgi:hypothetical protein